MTTLYVQFADNSDATIVSYFSCPQDQQVWPNQGTVAPSDARWHAYYASMPAFVQGFLPTPT